MFIELIILNILFSWYPKEIIFKIVELKKQTKNSLERFNSVSEQAEGRINELQDRPTEMT